MLWLIGAVGFIKLLFPLGDTALGSFAAKIAEENRKQKINTPKIKTLRFFVENIFPPSAG
ncbi:MAG: hypothetical protein ABII96_06875 [Candidatus Zixiibacteriota bacterium]